MSDRNETEAKRRQYTQEFKTEAVRLLKESGRTIAATARDLGINPNLLSRWHQEEHHAAARGTTRGTLKAEELVKLRRENELLRTERDFFKICGCQINRSLQHSPVVYLLEFHIPRSSSVVG